MALRILVVEDNLDTLHLYCEAILERAEHGEVNLSAQSTKKEDTIVEVEQSDSVSDALSKIRSNSYEVLVVDLKIPGTSGEEMGGSEVIMESLALDPLRPVIVITGFGTIQLVRKMLTQGVFDFIEKSETAVDDLVDSVQRAIKSRNEKIVRSGNPFTPTSMEPTVFGGRIAELEFFEKRLDRVLHGNHSEHFLVLGNWGIGKSTLLKEFKKICQNRGHIATMVQLEPFQAGSKLNDAAHSIIEGVLRDLPFSVDKFKRISKYFDTVGITVLGTGINLSRDTAKKELSPQSFLYNSLKNLWEDLKDNYGALVILLDDLDNFASVPEIVMTLKQTLTLDAINNSKILVGISSTHANWSEITTMKRNHPISRYFLDRVELNPLSEPEMRETILRSLTGTGVSFSPEVISRVFEYTKGHPFEMQVMCRNLFDNQLSQQVNLDLWEKAFESSLRDLGVGVFDNWFKEASPEEAKVLRAIAEADSMVSIKGIYKLCDKKKTKISEKSIAKYLQRLVEKQLVERAVRGQYSIPDTMFRAYLRQRVPF